MKIKLDFWDKLKKGWCAGVGEFLAELIVDTCICFMIYSRNMLGRICLYDHFKHYIRCNNFRACIISHRT